MAKEVLVTEEEFKTGSDIQSMEADVMNNLDSIILKIEAEEILDDEF